MATRCRNLPARMTDEEFHWILIKDGRNANAHDPQTRSRIKAQAMRNTANARRKLARNPQFKIDFIDPNRTQLPVVGVDYRRSELGTATWHSPLTHKANSEASTRHSSLQNKGVHRLVLGADPGAGRKDPFTSYPVYMTDRMHAMMEYGESYLSRHPLPLLPQDISFLWMQPVTLPTRHCAYSINSGSQLRWKMRPPSTRSCPTLHLLSPN